MKFNLSQHLRKLYKNYDVPQLHTILNTYSDLLKENKEVILIPRLLESLSTFAYLPLVNSFITEMSRIANNNHNKYLLEHTIASLNTDDHIFNIIRTELEEMLPLTESEIALKLKDYTDWTIYPEILHLREGVLNHTYGFNDNDSFSISKLYSAVTPINEHSILFNIKDKFLIFNTRKNIIEESFENVEQTFLNLCSIVNECYINDESIIYETNDFEFKIDRHKNIYFNNTDITENSYDFIRESLSGYNLGLSNQLNLLVENRNNITELDFAYNIKNNNNEFSLLYLGENKIWLNDHSSNVSLFQEYSINECKNIINQRLNIKIEDHLTFLQKRDILENKQLIQQKNELVQAISWIVEQKNDLLQTQELTQENVKTIRLYENEIKDLQYRLGLIHTALNTSVLERHNDMGYFHGALNYQYSNLPKGTHILVPNTFNPKSDDTIVLECKTMDGLTIDIPSKFIIV